MKLVGINDLLTEADAREMDARFERVLRARKEYEDRLGEGFREAVRRELLDLEVEVPEFSLR